MKTINNTESELILKCQNGCTESFNILVEENSEKIFCWILSKTKNEEWAEEIYQKTLIKSWRNISKFKGDSSYSTWANAIARNLFIDDYRKRKRSRESSLEAIQETDAGNECNNRGIPQEHLPVISPSEQLLQGSDLFENKKQVEKVLGKLSPNHREVLSLYFFDELSYKQIAKKTKCSVGTVMSRLFYAKKNAFRVLKCL